MSVSILGSGFYARLIRRSHSAAFFEGPQREGQTDHCSAAHHAEGSAVRTVAVKSTSAATATWRVPGKKKAHLQQRAFLGSR